MLAESVRSKTAGDTKARTAAGDHIQHQGGNDCADNLGDDIRQHLDGRKPFADHQANRDGRIEMSARDVTHRKSHREYSKAESESYTRESDPKFGKTCRQHSAAASAKDKHEGAEKLGA